MNGLAVGEGLGLPQTAEILPSVAVRKTGGETPPLQNKHHSNILLIANILQTFAPHKITSVGRPILSVGKSIPLQ